MSPFDPRAIMLNAAIGLVTSIVGSLIIRKKESEPSDDENKPNEPETSPPPSEQPDEPVVIETFMPNIQNDMGMKLIQKAETDNRFQSVLKRYQHVFENPNFRPDNPFDREGMEAVAELKAVTEEVVGEELPSIMNKYGLKPPVHTPLNQLFHQNLNRRKIKKFF